MPEPPPHRTRLLTVAGHLGAVGGSEVAQLRVVDGLASDGWEVELIYTSAGDLWPQWRALATRARAVGATQFERGALVRSGLGCARTLVESVRSGAEVVYLHNPGDLEVALAASRLARVPVVVHLHLPPPSRQHPWLHRLIRHADARIAPSHDAARRWADVVGLPVAACTVIPTGIDGGRFAPLGATERAAHRRALGLDPDRPLVLYAGRIDPTKGIDVLADALSAMATPAHLALCGPVSDAGYADRLRHQLGAAGATWLGQRREVAHLLASADLVVLPSLVPETQGLVVSEAMSCGVPAVASRIGGLPEALAGFPDHLFPPGDASALSVLLDRLIDWRRERPDLGPAGRSWVSGHLGLDATVGAVSSLLQVVGRH